jgi:LPS sulfotransferase NodH
MLAPVGVSVYTRLGHFKKAIEALKANKLACETNLIIYSDAAFKPEDEEMVAQVREYSHSITGFRTVTVIERLVNYGGVSNAHEGLKQLLRVFKVVICVEDDIEVAPGFLAFMNKALAFYKNNPSVVSISGYSPPIEIENYVDKDFYVMNRFCGWGCGVYERSLEWFTTKISQEEFDSVSDKNLLCEFGDDVLHMVKKEVTGELDAADVRCMFRQAIHGGATIYPRYSLVQNNGHDGSGYHCGKTNRFHHQSLWKKVENFSFDDELTIDERIRKEKSDFRAFRGKYAKFRLINSLDLSKEIASSVIDQYFEKTLHQLIKKQIPDISKVGKRIAILSTPRVGSTWLCKLLTPYFSASITHEWFHPRFVVKYLQIVEGSSPQDYLQFVKDKAFIDCFANGFHLHVNQYHFWMQYHNIDLIRFFDFDSVVYLSRKEKFSQIYSLAVASESTLWGNELIAELNIAEQFQVKINHEQFDKAEKALNEEFKYFTEYLKQHVEHFICYEHFCEKGSLMVEQLFESELKLHPEHPAIQTSSFKRENTIIDQDNKNLMKAHFNTNNLKKSRRYDL